MIAMTGRQRQHLVQKQHWRSALSRCKEECHGVGGWTWERRKGRSQGGWQLPGEGMCSSTACSTPVLRGGLQALLLSTPSRGHAECPCCALPLGWQPRPGTPYPPLAALGGEPLILGLLSTAPHLRPCAALCRLHNPVQWPSLRNLQEHTATEGQAPAKSLPSPGKHIKSCRNRWSSTRSENPVPNSDSSACAALVFSHKPCLETWKPLLD